jgi:acetyl-CoA carboxylase biotin carboxyl carrier protein
MGGTRVNIQEIKELMEKMAETGLTQLDLEIAGAKLRLERAHPVMVHQTAAPDQAAYAAMAANYATSLPAAALLAAPVAAAAAPAAPAEPEAEEGQIVTSPVVGVYYAAASPDSDPFITVGAKVDVGSPLCIIEAMKLMNEVTCPWEGVVLEIMVENGQRVEFGQPLFRIGGI